MRTLVPANSYENSTLSPLTRQYFPVLFAHCILGCVQFKIKWGSHSKAILSFRKKYKGNDYMMYICMTEYLYDYIHVYTMCRYINMTQYLYDSISVWLYIYITLYLYDSISIWLYICMTLYVYDSISVWLYINICNTVRLYDCISIYLYSKI